MAKGKGKVNLGNSLLIENVKESKEKFDKVFSGEEAFIVRSDEIAQIDLTGIQLLNYMVSRCESEGKKVNFKLTIAKEHRPMLIKNGFSELIQKVFV